MERFRSNSEIAPVVPANCPGKWVQWLSVRHNDGRRASGVGYNRSKFHFKLESSDYACLCGKEIQIPSNGLHEGSSIPATCKLCEKRLRKLSAENAVDKVEKYLTQKGEIGERRDLEKEKRKSNGPE